MPASNFSASFVKSLFTLGTMALVACGGARPAVSQYRGVLPVPEYPANPSRPFFLTDGDSEVIFNSSLIFWSETPTPVQVQAILEHTHGARILKSKALVELTEVITPGKNEVTAARSTYESYDSKIIDASKNIDKSTVREYVGGVASNFFDDRLNELVASQLITAADKTHAQAIWPAYCEAKLWELATNGQLSRNFTRRPTPLHLCEAYYASKNYFADATLCGSSPDASGKSYFMCIWREGLLKSALFAESYRDARCTPASSPYANRLAAISDWLGTEGGILKATLEGADAAAANIERTILLGDLIDRKAISFKDCRNAFVRKEPTIAGNGEVPDWTLFKPETLLQIGEVSENGSSEALRLIPLTSSDVTNKKVYGRLISVIKSFSQRPGIAASANSYKSDNITKLADGGGPRIAADASSLHPVPSYSDAMFNIVVGEALVANNRYADTVESDSAFAGIKAFESSSVKALKAEQAQALAVWNEAVARYADEKAHYNEQSKPGIDNNRLSTVDVVKDPGAAVYLNNYFMNVQKVGGELRVQIGFDLATQQLFGCVNIADVTQCVVSGDQLGASGIKLDVRFDNAANLISVKFPLADPAGLGFPDLPRTPGGVQFNEMTSLKGRTVQIDNYTNQLPGELRIITGNGYILDAAGNQLNSGSITGDNFTQREQALSSQQ